MRVAKDLRPDTSLNKLSGVGEATATALARLGLVTVEDLLTYLPFRLEDRSQLVRINRLMADKDVAISGTIKNVSSRKSKRGVLIIQATVEDDSGKLPALWFNQRYLLRYLQPGKKIMIFGSKKIAPPLGNPFITKAIINRAEVVPVYRSTKGLSQGAMRRLLAAVKEISGQLPDLLPENTRRQYELPKRAEVVPKCHFQSSEAALEASRQLLAFEELTLLALTVLKTRAERQQQKCQPIIVDAEFLKTLAAKLPFELTSGQRRAAWEIIQDLTQTTPMNRLLYGEVGSGKTAVALLTSAAVIRSNRRVAFLAPTTALAHQHAQTAKDILTPLGIQSALLTGAYKDDHTEADLVIGTHALLQKSVLIDRLGLVIVDEQHRFGVEQRQHFLNAHAELPLLMMTATPIPRSLAQTVFGQLNISYLTGKPTHQRAIDTVVFKENGRAIVEKDIKARITRGEPGYVICPLIEPADSLEIPDDLFQVERKAVKSELARLKKQFPHARIALLHGRMKAAEKEKTLQDFRDGKLDILLSTTVVEVGIDNPRASWILVEEADRFGLNQLHQLRGRVGRGERASVCFLADSGASTVGRERLEVIAETTDGLKLAEYDLQLRGPGELIGYEQSGLPPLRYANWQDLDLVKKTFAAAQKILENGITNNSPLAAALKRIDQQTTVA